MIGFLKSLFKAAEDVERSTGAISDAHAHYRQEVTADSRKLLQKARKDPGNVDIIPIIPFLTDSDIENQKNKFKSLKIISKTHSYRLIDYLSTIVDSIPEGRYQRITYLLTAYCKLKLMFECDQCEKAFLTAQAEYGHRSMCPENSDRPITDQWYPQTHGRWAADHVKPQSI